MLVPSYAQVLALVERLSPAEQQQLVADLTSRLERHVEPPHRVTEFRGKGKANSIGIDAQAYVNQERDAWIG